MTKDDEVISHLNCACNLKEQGYTDEAMDEILKALCVMLERDIPRAGERIKSPCRRGQCKKCLIEDGGCKECGAMAGFGGVCRKCNSRDFAKAEDFIKTGKHTGKDIEESIIER